MRVQDMYSTSELKCWKTEARYMKGWPPLKFNDSY